MHSRDTAILVALLWSNFVHYSSLFQYFFLIYYGSYSTGVVKNSIFKWNSLWYDWSACILHWVVLYPSVINSIRNALFSAMLSLLHSSGNQQLFFLYNQSNHYENIDNFCYERKSSRANHNWIDTFTASKDKWHTKEDAGKSMKNALCTLKRLLSG